MAGLKNLKPLKSKEVKEINKILEEQWGTTLDKEYAFFLNTKEQKIFITNKDITVIDFNKFNINMIGLYIGELQPTEIRLSIEGAQLIGKTAKKNVIELSEEEAMQYVKGKDLEKDIPETGYLILKHKKDILGCGRMKDNKILCFYPKTRRLP